MLCLLVSSISSGVDNRNDLGDLRASNLLKLSEEKSCVDCDLIGANLSDANLNGADLTGAKLEGANFEGATLVEANLTGADLTGVDLTRTDCTKANFTKAILIRTSVPWPAQRENAIFKGAKVGLINWIDLVEHL